MVLTASTRLRSSAPANPRTAAAAPPAAPPPAGLARPSRRSSWPALILTAVSRAVLMALGSLLLWSLAPALLGWHPTVVMTGSMQPRLHPGDVIVARPVPTTSLHLGEILLVDDPDHGGHLRLHRYVKANPDGTLILRGDANNADDSSPRVRVCGARCGRTADTPHR